MTIRKNLTQISLQDDAREFLRLYQLSPNADLDHPAIQAMKEFAKTGKFSNKNNPGLSDLFLQMQVLAIRSSGKSYEETLEHLALRLPMSESTIGRRIKRKVAMPPDLEELTGSDELFKFLFHKAQEKSRS